MTDKNLPLSGDTADLAKAVAACRGTGPYKVPSLVQEWRAITDEAGHWSEIIRLPIGHRAPFGSANKSPVARRSKHEAALIKFAAAMKPGRRAISDVGHVLDIPWGSLCWVVKILKNEKSALCTSLMQLGVRCETECFGRRARTYLVKAQGRAVR
jgi:hypothetical protein